MAPSKNTRETLVEWMTRNLTSEFTRKYGSLSPEEAEENAKRIEDEAFTTANQHYEKEPDGDGGSALQLYAKEYSKLILEVLKIGPKGKDEKHFKFDGGIALSEALENCIHLKKLDFRDNVFGVDAGVSLSKVLSKRANLTKVYLPDFGRRGGNRYSQCSQRDSPLTVLDMAGNNITVEAALALSVCIAAKSLFTKLKLAENELKDDGAIQIGKALQEGHQQLQKLI